MSSSVLLMAALGLCVVGCSGGDESHTGMENTEWGGLVVRREDGSRGGGGEGGGGGGGDECPTWTLPAGNGSHLCFCGSSLRGTVRCNPHTLDVSIPNGYCMTHNHTHDITYTAHCPYGLKHYSNQNYYIGLPHNVSKLNSAMCGPLNRQGRVCGRCKSGYGPAVFSTNLNCYRCSGSYHGWGLYLFLELFPVTVIFILIVFFQFHATSGSINCFLLLSQIAVAKYQYNLPKGSYPFGQSSESLIKTILVLYGFWNLDFFRPLVPPFCVSQNITGLHANALLYIAVIHLLLLTALAYLLIELHARNYRIIVWLWRPIHKYYVKVHRNVNPRTSIIDAFATILILSYSRIMLASFSLLAPGRLYAPTGKVVKYVVYFDNHLNYFSAQHIPFVLLGVIVLVLFNIPPAVFLLLYPCKCFQMFLGRFRRTSQLLCPFADTFQGCYKNGTDGGRDYRYFAGLYMVFRIALYISHLTVGSPANWFLPGLLYLLASLTFAGLKPYRNDSFNVIDSLLFALASVGAFSQTMVVAGGVGSTRLYQIFVQLIDLTPLVYITGYVLYRHIFTPLYRLAKRERLERGMTDASSGETDSEDLPHRLIVESPTTSQTYRWHSDTNYGSINTYLTTFTY